MRILLTNDDGIHAPGLSVLERVAKQLSDDLWVVAPETDQSGVSHSVSLNAPLRLREIDPRRFAVQGTPTDCVLMAVHHVMKHAKPDLVLSGVNLGHNLAEDVIYSGTVAGAMEGAILGIPSIALSQGFSPGERNMADFNCAEAQGAEIVRRILAQGIQPDELVNVNFPAMPPGQKAVAELTQQGRRDMNLASIEERHDGRGKPYYWIRYTRSRATPPTGTDLEAVYAGKISITPLRLDMTDRRSLRRLADGFK